MLINGRRQTISGALANDGSVFVDTSSIPINALERVEVLKEGAASTYGSDAIAGVVNLILRKDFDGFELSASTQQVSDGDQDDNSVGFIWGRGNDTTHVTFAGNYLDRSALSAADRPNLVDQANSSLGSSFIALPHVVGLPSVTVDSGPYARHLYSGAIHSPTQTVQVTQKVGQSAIFYVALPMVRDSILLPPKLELRYMLI